MRNRFQGSGRPSTKKTGRTMNAEAARIEHLKLIQAVVARLGRNSFAIKSTAAAVSAALVAFTASVGSPFAALGGFAVLSLWLLDARFLRQERAFRRLFDSIRTGLPKEHGADKRKNGNGLCDHRGSTNGRRRHCGPVPRVRGRIPCQQPSMPPVRRAPWGTLRPLLRHVAGVGQMKRENWLR